MSGAEMCVLWPWTMGAVCAWVGIRAGAIIGGDRPSHYAVIPMALCWPVVAPALGVVCLAIIWRDSWQA